MSVVGRTVSQPGAGKKLYKLEALRGLAAFYVVLHHTLPHHYPVGGFNLYNFFRLGQEAVILFFLLSGFVICFSHILSADKSFKQYFWKRFLRIYIPLLCVFILSYVIFSNNAGELINPDIKSLFGNLFMLQDWAKVKPYSIVDPYLENNPLWSLSYEWWFYMLFFPITAFIKSSSARNHAVYFVCILAATLYAFYPLFPVRVVMYFAIWWTGVVLANIYVNQKRYSLSTIKLPIISLLMIIAILSANVFQASVDGAKISPGLHPLLELRHFMFALVAVLLAILWRKAGWPLFDRLVKPFVIIAPISYTIYILHLPVMSQSSFLQWIESPLLQWVAYFITLIALAYLIEIVIYPRLRRFAIRLIHKRSAD